MQILTTMLGNLIDEVKELGSASNNSRARHLEYQEMRRPLWTAPSPDLTPCDYYLCESLNDGPHNNSRTGRPQNHHQARRIGNL